MNEHIVFIPGFTCIQNPDSINVLAKRYSQKVTEKTHLIGWSFGGLVALEIAKKIKVKSLTLLACSPKFVETKNWPGIKKAEARAFLTKMKRKPLACIQEFRKRIGLDPSDAKHNLEGEYRFLESALRADYRDCIPSGCKWILGSEDEILPPDFGEYLNDVWVFDGLRHNLNWIHTEAAPKHNSFFVIPAKGEEDQKKHCFFPMNGVGTEPQPGFQAEQDSEAMKGIQLRPCFSWIPASAGMTKFKAIDERMRPLRYLCNNATEAGMTNNSPQENIQKNFNRASTSYLKHNHVQRAVFEELKTLITLYLKNQDTILDCGSGQFPSYQHFPNQTVIALDFAHQTLTQPNFIQANFNHIPRPNNSFDAIFSNMAIHWSDDILQTLKHWKQKIRHSGYIAFSLPIQGTFRSFHQILFDKNIKAPFHFYHQKEILDMLQKTGLNIMQFKTCQYTLSFDSVKEAMQYLKKTGVRYAQSKLSFRQGKQLLTHKEEIKFEFEVLLVLTNNTVLT